ncbi:MBL fold metallo-hydrolase [Segetibacter sp. 3557_3]|uniref:MBL fold metallo-hydrolase n=1 Tax=Segetibacter sp. 3557_3 TaxID=2547429 RepID=UPI0010592170|nr:MBL fold metallo-hydrolase [Segetibacter sp. 3557_3]TDH23350.1 MBL fold metallo-hydrolase [Segetibacter sp. 3557_3]
MLTVSFFTFSPVQENTYIVSNDQNEAIIFDPGCYSIQEKNRLKQHLTDKGLTAVQLVNTHCHLDHVFGNKWVAETYDLELFLHPLEEQLLAYAPTSGDKWGLPFNNYEGKLHFLNEGDVVNLGTDSLKVMLTPGHSPGSICFYCEEQGFVIGGDVLFRESVGRTDLPFGSYEQLMNSIRTKLFTLPDDVIVYPGHGPSTTIGWEKKHNPFLAE